MSYLKTLALRLYDDNEEHLELFEFYSKNVNKDGRGKKTQRLIQRALLEYARKSDQGTPIATEGTVNVTAGTPIVTKHTEPERSNSIERTVIDTVEKPDKQALGTVIGDLKSQLGIS